MTSGTKQTERVSILRRYPSISMDELPDLKSICKSKEDFAEFREIEAEVRERHDQYRVETLDEVAAFFEVSRETVKSWKFRTRLSSDPMPGQPGNYNISEIVQWRMRTGG